MSDESYRGGDEIPVPDHIMEWLREHWGIADQIHADQVRRDHLAMNELRKLSKLWGFEFDKGLTAFEMEDWGYDPDDPDDPDYDEEDKVGFVQDPAEAVMNRIRME